MIETKLWQECATLAPAGERVFRIAQEREGVKREFVEGTIADFEGYLTAMRELAGPLGGTPPRGAA